MFDFIFEAFRLVNLPFTVLLGLIVCYWLLVSLGALDFDAIDLPDAEVGGGDVGLEPGGGPMNVQGGLVSGAFRSVLQFLNFGDVPAMIVVSIMALAVWTFSMLSNHYFNEGSWLVAAGLLVPNVIVAGLITKAATTPLKKLFNAMNREYEEHKPVVGRTCTIITTEVTENFGQAQVETSGAPLIINVRTYGEAAFAKGESALIIREDKENNIYTVAKLESTTKPQESHLC